MLKLNKEYYLQIRIIFWNFENALVQIYRIVKPSIVAQKTCWSKKKSPPSFFPIQKVKKKICIEYQMRAYKIAVLSNKKKMQVAPNRQRV